MPEVDFAKCAKCRKDTVVMVENGLCDACFEEIEFAGLTK